MLDLNFVRDNLPLVEEKLRQRGMDPANVLKDFHQVDTQRRYAITAQGRLLLEQWVDALRHSQDRTGRFLERYEEGR